MEDIVTKVTPLESVFLQKHAFERGWKWAGGEKNVKNTDLEYLHFYSDKIIRCSYSLRSAPPLTLCNNAEEIFDFFDKKEEKKEVPFEELVDGSARLKVSWHPDGLHFGYGMFHLTKEMIRDAFCYYFTSNPAKGMFTDDEIELLYFEKCVSDEGVDVGVEAIKCFCGCGHIITKGVAMQRINLLNRYIKNGVKK